MSQETIGLRPGKHQSINWNKIIIEAITAIFIILWIYTGISKIIDFYNFRYQLSKWDVLKGYAELISYVIPILELTLAVLLIPARTRKLGMWLSFSLMLFFTLYVGLILSFVKELPCTCGGVISTMSWQNHLALNIVLTILAFAGILLLRKKKSTP